MMTNKGQTLIEFILIAVICVVIVVGGFHLFWKCWVRVKCAYHVFEATHAKVTGASHRSAYFVQFDDDGKTVRGEAECEMKFHEAVRLPHLEDAQW